MTSMTGYAYQESRGEDLRASIEIKGYNSRFLDLAVLLPPRLSGLEPLIRDITTRQIRRGKVDVVVRLWDLRETFSVSLNPGVVRAYQEAAALLEEYFPGAGKLTLSTLFGLEGVLDIEENRDDGRCQALLEPLLQAALERFQQEREREGRHTQEDILKHLDLLEASAAFIASQVPALEKTIQENIRNRFRELLGDQIDETRVLSETALLLMKYSIAEELSRLEAHFREFRREAEHNPSPGKKLDFLCQEIQREINTLGSKSPQVELSRAVVEMKNALEDIREQLRNVE